MPCFTSIHSVLDRAATTVQEVATFKLRGAWADLEHKADDLRPLAGGSQNGGSWKTAIEENKTFDQMVELGQPLLTLLDHDQLKGSIRAVHQALDSSTFTHSPLENLLNSNQATLKQREHVDYADAQQVSGSACCESHLNLEGLGTCPTLLQIFRDPVGGKSRGRGAHRLHDAIGPHDTRRKANH